MKQTCFFILLWTLLSGCGINEVNGRSYVISKSHEEMPIEVNLPLSNEEI